ncbi:Gfo/Idh/MocA family protein [Brenneria tiliae]|uniref:Gfo/Idh/MocA family protein n=1 Tax=Brenneria tiliae TaxID=2914984 RepID=UPI002014E3F7|nr:Gfo/Idh/MocA family oxidoreductase [Brenneria tiliae]MCL2895871.1 Gfo/Idh/MocA family oxidoreductase [Brenneria tiliae]MCL2900411.1 Gfo/Idh/MocA family oxidoreductase [Brenneria tiliae]
MIRFGIVGTNWITRKFIDAAHETGKMKLTAIYARSPEKARQFQADYAVGALFSSLEEMARSDLIDGVYIASPNSLHCEQSLVFLRHGKHVICEKPLASNWREAERMIACAREKRVVLFEAFKTASLVNFNIVKQSLPGLGKLRKALLNYCQFSSRYPRYLAGENPNTFNPAFSNGSIMDIGFYCLAFAVALWGRPNSVLASATLLESGVDALGSVILNYGDFDVTIIHSKVSHTAIPSEIQGEEGTLVIEHLSECQRVTLVMRDGSRRELGQSPPANSMVSEAETFASLVNSRNVEHPGLEHSRIVAELLTEIRRQTGVVFPADYDR